MVLEVDIWNARLREKGRHGLIELATGLMKDLYKVEMEWSFEIEKPVFLQPPENVRFSNEARFILSRAPQSKFEQYQADKSTKASNSSQFLQDRKDQMGFYVTAQTTQGSILYCLYFKVGRSSVVAGHLKVITLQKEPDISKSDFLILAQNLCAAFPADAWQKYSGGVPQPIAQPTSG